MKETECRDIYRKSFCDSDTYFENLLFKYCFKYSETLEVDGKTVSMLFALPVTLETAAGETDGVYIYAAATDTESRGKGYMHKLLEKVKAKCDLLILRPANDALRKYYEKFDFKTVLSDDRSIITVTPKGGYLELVTAADLKPERESFTAMYYSKNSIDLNNIHLPFSMF